MRFGYSKDPFANIRVVRSGIAELLPVVKPTTSNYVVYRCQCPPRMIQMTVQHALNYSSLEVEAKVESLRSQIATSKRQLEITICDLKYGTQRPS